MTRNALPSAQNPAVAGHALDAVRGFLAALAWAGLIRRIGGGQRLWRQPRQRAHQVGGGGHINSLACQRRYQWAQQVRQLLHIPADTKDIGRLARCK